MPELPIQWLIIWCLAKVKNGSVKKQRKHTSCQLNSSLSCHPTASWVILRNFWANVHSIWESWQFREYFQNVGSCGDVAIPYMDYMYKRDFTYWAINQAHHKASLKTSFVDLNIQQSQLSPAAGFKKDWGVVWITTMIGVVFVLEFFRPLIRGIACVGKIRQIHSWTLSLIRIQKTVIEDS